MSEFSESQRRSWNNDGMDPDWKPEFKPIKFKTIESIMNLYRAFGVVANSLEKYSDEDLQKLKRDDMSIRFILTIDQCVVIRNAIKEFKGEKSK